jgi:hypothetical protein
MALKSGSSSIRHMPRVMRRCSSRGAAFSYVHALRDGHAPDNPRIGPSATFGKDWLPGVYEWQRQVLAKKRGQDGTPG